MTVVMFPPRAQLLPGPSVSGVHAIYCQCTQLGLTTHICVIDPPVQCLVTPISRVRVLTWLLLSSHLSELILPHLSCSRTRIRLRLRHNIESYTLFSRYYFIVYLNQMFWKMLTCTCADLIAQCWCSPWFSSPNYALNYDCLVLLFYTGAGSEAGLPAYHHHSEEWTDVRPMGGGELLD